mmetsp:Transcript_16803/g.26050  ORF Transcript_16803/g.26050 Transcript_16803/m.26050 type:complete len:405 (+) Transcript_16803:3-1217(+)
MGRLGGMLLRTSAAKGSGKRMAILCPLLLLPSATAFSSPISLSLRTSTIRSTVSSASVPVSPLAWARTSASASRFLSPTLPSSRSSPLRLCMVEAGSKTTPGDFLQLTYTLSLADGTVIDSTENRKDPYLDEVGNSQLPAPVAKEVESLEIGGSTKVRLEPEQAFGEYKEELAFEVSKAQLGPQADDMKEGMKVQLITGAVAAITKVTEDTVTIDANNEHAGKALFFEVKVEKLAKKASEIETATFAGGCFWGLELAYQRVPGVLGSAVGYTQGEKQDPTYEEVCSGSTGHTEAVQVKFDPSVVSYDKLLDVFFGRVDVTQLNQQGNDMGTQYRNGIYFHNEEQKKVAEKYKAEAQEKFGKKPVVTEILEEDKFWKAEDYHQQYLEKGGQDASKGAEETIRCYG